jgi:hypothetical protein
MRFLYRLLLLAYPPSLRDAYGSEMTMVLKDAWTNASARGWRSRARFLGRMLNDFFQSLPGAWRTGPHHVPPQKKDSMIMTMLRELRLSARTLWQSRWSTAATVLTLSLAIGATAGVFSVVNAVVFRPLPYADADRLVEVRGSLPSIGADVLPLSPPEFADVRDRARSFESVAVPDTETHSRVRSL